MELILFHSIVTFILLGLILVVQVVHYPYFSFTDNNNAINAFKFHQQRIGYVVVPLMISELVSGIYLSFKMWSPFWQIQLINLSLIFIIWFHTFLIMVPLHNQLTQEPTPIIIKALVKQNWIRTFAWSVKALLWALILWHLIGVSHG